MTQHKISFKSFSLFLIQFILNNFFWIVPIIIILQGTIIKVIFFSFFVTFIYISAVKYFKENHVSLISVSKRIEILYYITISIFLCLTGIATFEGIMNVFGLVGWVKVGFAIFFALAITLALLYLTFCIKERRTPSFILAALMAYLVCDFFTALPFNYLFFYENLKTASNIEFDKKNITVVINACDSIIRPKYTTAEKKLINNRSKIRDQISLEKINYDLNLKIGTERLKSRYNNGNGTINRAEYNKELNDLQKGKTHKNISFNKDETEINIKSYADSIAYKRLLNSLDSCKNKNFIFVKTSNTNDASKLSNELKINLTSIINSSQDSNLKKYIILLYPNKPSSLQSILQLYNFIARKLSINESKQTDDADKNYDKDTDMLITMSLSCSIVIDILPLLLSILYAQFKRVD